nr:MetaGeneMark_Unknown Function [uncultured bacterium]
MKGNGNLYDRRHTSQAILFHIFEPPMKRAVSIVLIVLMSLQSLYRLGLITYFEANRDYIAKVLCINKSKPSGHCNGHCFLKKNLQKAEQSETIPSGAAREKIAAPDFLPEHFTILLNKPFTVVSNHSLYSLSVSEGIHEGIFKPPVS